MPVSEFERSEVGGEECAMDIQGWNRVLNQGGIVRRGGSENYILNFYRNYSSFKCAFLAISFFLKLYKFLT